ncbi:MAG TPA: NUDIX hydrolase [Allosphingosinicella sp.]|jgi:8-oxo-dGTP pyrophosphatase MutT (NUDIX family)
MSFEVPGLEAYPNRKVAEEDIKRAVRRATAISIISNKGTDWLGPDGLLCSSLAENAAKGDRLRLRTLLLHPAAPWLAYRAMEKHFWTRDPKLIEAQFREAHGQVAEYCRLHRYPPPRFHRHDPAWRFVMTDQEIFLQTYARGQQINDETVLKLPYGSPVYLSASRYFDYLYELDSAEMDQISPLEAGRQRFVSHETSAGLVVGRTAGARHQLLLIPTRRGYALSKGGVKDGEELLEAAVRELWEETGLLLENGPATYSGTEFVEQPLHPELSMKVIIFHYRQLTAVESALPHKAEWVDISDIDKLQFAYSYVHSALRKVVHTIDGMATDQ